MKYWLMKTEPAAYSFEQLLLDGKTIWDGVRNYQARNNLKAMAVGDQVLIYHSVSDKAIVGLAQVNKSHFPEPGAENTAWVSVEIVPLYPLKKPLSLEQIKSNPKLQETGLIKQQRLSVMPLTPIEFKEILKMAEK